MSDEPVGDLARPLCGDPRIRRRLANVSAASSRARCAADRVRAATILITELLGHSTDTTRRYTTHC